MCCVYDGLEPYNHYEPQQDTNNPNSMKYMRTFSDLYIEDWIPPDMFRLFSNMFIKNSQGGWDE
jgi:hypothetical protein